MIFASIVTVLEPAATVDLTTLERAKQELGETSNENDGLISSWIHEVSAHIASACGRTFGLETVEETFDPSWPHEGHQSLSTSTPLCLSRWPVTEVQSVTVNGTALDAEDYRVDTSTGMLHRVSCRWHGQVVVVYSAGYELVTNLPYDIEQACLLMLRYRKSAATRDPAVRSKNVYDVMAVTYWQQTAMPVQGQDGQLPPDVDALLQPYKALTVA